MRIGGSRNQVPGLVRRRSRAVARYAVLVWSAVLLVLFCLWRPGGVPVAGLFSLVLGVAAVVHVGWVIVRRRRLVGRAVAEAEVREQRLAAALSRGPRRPSPQPAAADPGAQRRRDLLDAVEEHGGLSPEARAAAAEITRHRTK
jgi:hypothetical protein